MFFVAQKRYFRILVHDFD